MSKTMVQRLAANKKPKSRWLERLPYFLILDRCTLIIVERGWRQKKIRRKEERLKKAMIACRRMSFLLLRYVR